MTIPVVILTDHLNGATGTLTIEEGHCCHFQCVSASTLGGGEWVQAKIEWSITETSEPYNSGVRGFNFSHYCPTAGTYTVTCTVTNVNGETGSGQCVVTVAASTRSIVNVNEGDDLYAIWNANSGDNVEFVLTGNVNCSDAIDLESNIVIRSSVAGTKRTVTLTGSTTAFIDAVPTSDSVTIKEINVELGVGATKKTLFISLDGVNNNLIDVDILDPDIMGATGQMINLSSNPVGVLIQDVNTINDGAGQCIWGGNSPISDRLLAIYGGTHHTEINNLERCFRGHARYVSFHETTLTRTSAIKECCSYAEIEYGYMFKTTLLNQSSSGTSGPLLVGHTSGPNTSAHCVFERCLFGVENRANADIRFGPNDAFAVDIVFRNCLFLNVEMRLGTVTGLRFYHNTFYQSLGARKFLRSGDNLVHSGIFANGNLMVVGSANTYSLAFTTAIGIDTVIDDISNNVTGDVSTADVDINDTVNGNSDENYATFNARALASGNLRKTVTIDGSYRPENTEDTDLLIVPHSDMDIFAEDYYGNPRVNPSWLVGAVDVNPFLYYSIRTAGGSLFLKTVGG